MNHFFFENQAKEKLNSLQQEGMTSQAHYRSGAARASLRSRFLQFLLIVLMMLVIFQIVVR